MLTALIIFGLIAAGVIWYGVWVIKRGAYRE